MSHSTINDRKKIRHRTIRILAVLFWIGIWQAVSMWLGQEILLASPASVIKKLLELVVTLEFWRAVGFSFGRIVLGFLGAVLLGVFLGISSYAFSVVEILLSPLISVIKATPVASFIILCLIWIPSRNLSIFISFLMVLPVIYTNVLTGIRETDQQLLQMAAVFHVGIGRKVYYIYFSQVLPYFVSACRLSLGMCWKAGVAAEVIGVPSGSLGEKLYHAKIYLNTPELFAWTLVIIMVSVVFEKFFIWMLNRLKKCVEQH